MTATQSTYAGGDWLQAAFKIQISTFGHQVADLLGDVYLGIYHANITGLKKADWLDEHYISVVVEGNGGQWSTTDSDLLTRLVVLAHDRCIRVSIQPASPTCMRLIFMSRTREGDSGQGHPELESHIQAIREAYLSRAAVSA